MYGTLFNAFDGLLGPERTVLFLHGICPPPGVEIDDRRWDPATWLMFQLAMLRTTAAEEY